MPLLAEHFHYAHRFRAKEMFNDQRSTRHSAQFEAHFILVAHPVSGRSHPPQMSKSRTIYWRFKTTPTRHAGQFSELLKRSFPGRSESSSSVIVRPYASRSVTSKLAQRSFPRRQCSTNSFQCGCAIRRFIFRKRASKTDLCDRAGAFALGVAELHSAVVRWTAPCQSRYSTEWNAIHDLAMCG